MRLPGWEPTGGPLCGPPLPPLLLGRLRHSGSGRWSRGFPEVGTFASHPGAGRRLGFTVAHAGAADRAAQDCRTVFPWGLKSGNPSQGGGQAGPLRVLRERVSCLCPSAGGPRQSWESAGLRPLRPNLCPHPRGHSPVCVCVCVPESPASYESIGPRAPPSPV